MFTDEPQEVDSPVIESNEEEPEIVEEETEESSTDWEAEAMKWKAIAKRHSKPKVEVAPLQGERGLSEDDIVALKGIDEADLPLVKELKSRLKLSYAEALNDKYVQAALREDREERRTARATETKSPRGLAKTSSEDILRKAESSGEVPETMEGMRALAEARMARRRK